MAMTTKTGVLRKASVTVIAKASGEDLTISQNVPQSGLDSDEIPTTANSLSDDNESNSDDESVWEGFDDLQERRELDHILILNKTLEDAGRSAL
jgi:hypothetical protein